MAAWEFLRTWREAACRAYRHQYGIYLALPLTWGCVGHYAMPRSAPFAYLALALFLEHRPGGRLAVQALLFTLWSAWLGMHAPTLPKADPGSDLSPGPRASAAPSGAEKGPQKRLEGRVRGFPAGSGTLAFTLAVPGTKLRIMAREPGFAVLPGQWLAVTGRDLPPERPTNPGQFDYSAYLRSQGISGLIRADSIRLLGPPGPIDRLVVEVRRALEAGLARTIPRAQRALFEAALLGDTAGLDPAVIEDFRASGMLHILAISGQHVGIIALILLQIFSLLRLPRKAAFLATGAVLAIYVPVCGGSISVVRSAIMFWCVLPSVLCERPALGLNNLALAACVCLLAMPYQILSLGFQLSFGATFFLILYSRPIAKTLAGINARGRLRGPLRSLAGYAWPTAALSGVIFLGMAPILASTVHSLSPTSVAGNLATVGLSSAMIAAGCLALLAAPAGLLGTCLGETAGLLAAFLASIIKLLARLPGSSLAAEALPAAWSLLLVSLLLAYPHALRRGHGRLLVLLGLAAFTGRWAAGAAWEVWRRPAQVAFLDVGQGDATVLRLPGADILVDAGPEDAGRKSILPYLRAAGINRLDMVLITHPDLDHYGGLAHLAGSVSIGKVVFSGEGAETRAWKQLDSILAGRKVPWAEARSGQYLYRYGKAEAEMELEVLSPERRGQFRNRNDNSLVCLLRLRHARVLLTGDMEKASQARLLERSQGRLSGSVLKVPHHGSDRTTDLAFLEALAPEAAVISAGRRNRFGHPGRGNLEILRRTGAVLFLTTSHGAVTYRNTRAGSGWSTFLPSGPAD